MESCRSYTAYNLLLVVYFIISIKIDSSGELKAKLFLYKTRGPREEIEGEFMSRPLTVKLAERIRFLGHF